MSPKGMYQYALKVTGTSEKVVGWLEKSRESVPRGGSGKKRSRTQTKKRNKFRNVGLIDRCFSFGGQVREGLQDWLCLGRWLCGGGGPQMKDSPPKGVGGKSFRKVETKWIHHRSRGGLLEPRRTELGKVCFSGQWKNRMFILLKFFIQRTALMTEGGEATEEGWESRGKKKAQGTLEGEPINALGTRMKGKIRGGAVAFNS